MSFYRLPTERLPIEELVQGMFTNGTGTDSQANIEEKIRRIRLFSLDPVLNVQIRGLFKRTYTQFTVTLKSRFAIHEFVSAPHEKMGFKLKLPSWLTMQTFYDQLKFEDTPLIVDMHFNMSAQYNEATLLVTTKPDTPIVDADYYPLNIHVPEDDR